MASAQQAGWASFPPLFALPTPAADRAWPSGDPPHVALTLQETSGGGQRQHSRSAVRPLCGVVKLLAQLWLPPALVQNAALVTLTTKGPYFPSSFIRAGFGLTGSGSGDVDKNKAALLLTLREVNKGGREVNKITPLNPGVSIIPHPQLVAVHLWANYLTSLGFHC